MDKIMKVLMDLREVLLRKRSSFAGTVGNQASVEARERIEQKIDKLTIKINEVNDAIQLRNIEIERNKNVSADRLCKVLTD